MEGSEIERYLLALLGLKGVGPGAVKKNLDKIQVSLSTSDVFEEPAPWLGDKADETSWRAALAQADRALERCSTVGIKAISIIDPNYPTRLLELSTPPPILFCRGNLSLLSRSALGVIGTRKSTEFGEIVARRIGSYFSGKGFPICNGLADGIDFCSVAPDDTMLPAVIGVMAAGLDLLETKLSSNRATERAARVLDADGLLVSEQLPGMDEDQNTVIASCRLQAGLSQVLLLVQSPSDGGSHFTVQHYCKLQRTLAYIVPSETQMADPAFQANAMLFRDENGLAEFAGLKTRKTLKARLLAVSSRDDYDIVQRELESTDTTLI